MSEASLNAFLAARADDAAVRLFADATAAMRLDAGYLAREDDLAASAFLDAETPSDLAGDALDHVLARIEAEGAKDEHAAERAAWGDPTVAEIAALPSPVRETALAALAHDRWRFGGLGIRRLPLGLGAGDCELMRIEPGHGAAAHDHDGDELTLILTGSYFDGHAHYAPGDVSLARQGFVHMPKADPGAVCYVLAVTYGPPRFKGLIGVLQRLIGFPRTPKPAARA